MKSIMLSIQPKWVAKIMNGEKTIEIRKTKPNCELPIDVYIYCTKDKKYANLINRGGFLTGMVVAKFTLNKVEEVVDNGSSYRINNDVAHTNEVARNSCLDFKEMKEYLGGKNGYAWHIDDLIVLNKPMEVNEFYKIKYRTEFEERYTPIKRAAQSWQYVEVE